MKPSKTSKTSFLDKYVVIDSICYLGMNLNTNSI